MHFDTIVGYTTRPKEDYETNGKEYWFLTEREAQRILTSQTIVTYTEIGGYKYFVTKQFLEDESKNLYIAYPGEIDYLIKKFENIREFKILYLITPKELRDAKSINEETYKVKCEAEDDQFIIFDTNIKNVGKDKYAYEGIEVKFVNGLNNIEQFILETCTHNILYLVVGRECSGKDILCKELIERFNRKNDD